MAKLDTGAPCTTGCIDRIPRTSVVVGSKMCLVGQANRGDERDENIHAPIQGRVVRNDAGRTNLQPPRHVGHERSVHGEPKRSAGIEKSCGSVERRCGAGQAGAVGNGPWPPSIDATSATNPGTHRGAGGRIEVGQGSQSNGGGGD